MAEKFPKREKSRHKQEDTSKRVGMSPLHTAAMNGQTNILQTLLQHGADVNMADKETGKTALHLAASNNDRRTMEALISRGADVTAKDSKGKSPMDLCKNRTMVKKMQDVKSMIQKTGEITETAKTSTHEEPDKEPDKVTPVPAGPTPVLSKLPSDLRQVGPVKQNNSVSMICHRHTIEHCTINFGIKDNEEICSDVFSHRLDKVNVGDSFVAGITVPLISKPTAGEELVLKTDQQQEYVLDDAKVDATGKYVCTFEVDLTSFKSLLVVSRPKLEAFTASSEASTLKSSVDDRVELDIPKGTFNAPTKITMEIIEPLSTTEEDISATPTGDIVSTSSFYSLESGGMDLSNPVKIKVAIESGSRVRSRMASTTPFPGSPALSTPDMYSFATIANIQSNVSKMYRKARRTEFEVSFLCMLKRHGYTNHFLVLIECCKTDSLSSRRKHWLNEGYEEQSARELSVTTIFSKQRFIIQSTNPAMQLCSDMNDNVIEFHPKLENYHIFNMSLLGDVSHSTGVIKIGKMEKFIKDGQVSYNITDTTVASMTITIYKFHPEMMSEREKKEFMGYQFMVQLQEGLDDRWFKILLLMGVSFKTIDDALRRKQGDRAEIINGLLLGWRDSNIKKIDRGLPRLLASLRKGGRYATYNIIRMQQLRDWHRQEQNRNNEFHKWVTKAYKDTSLFDEVEVYPEPMSDMYLVMLAGDVEPTVEFLQALDVSTSIITDVTHQRDVYVTDEMVVMKMFVHFRNDTPDKAKALQKLISVFESRGMTDKRGYAIMSVNAWLSRASDRRDKLTVDVQDFVKTLS